ncbi:hypothetical protein LI328DRAFT_6259 [Trichoderma asperelloides]|nr:hypothetical protein LI328DRAFT_6259 [Trichoderma asperelloides]
MHIFHVSNLSLLTLTACFFLFFFLSLSSLYSNKETPSKDYIREFKHPTSPFQQEDFVCFPFRPPKTPYNMFNACKQASKQSAIIKTQTDHFCLPFFISPFPFPLYISSSLLWFNI